jgi:hypothetical protein
VGNGIFFFKIYEIEAWSDLTELGVFLEELADLIFISLLVDLISAVKFLHIVHHAEDTIDLLLVLNPSLLRTAQVNSFIH